MSEMRAKNQEQTPVDDVRAVRERLSHEAGGDVRKLAEQSNRFRAIPKAAWDHARRDEEAATQKA